jgi:CheY-like chemotaxis protein
MPNSSAAPHGRILLVDDNMNGLTARKTVLEELGHKILLASSGAEALDQIRQHKFDLIVTDYKMPRMDGIELIGHLRREVPGVPVVLISGFVDALGMNEESTGADAVIQKSANEVAHLMRTVARLLRRKKGPDSASLRAKRKAV